MNVPYVNLFEPELPPDVTKLLKPDAAKKYGVMPIKKEINSLTLAMSDPTDIGIMDEVRFITGLSIKPVLAMASEIKDAIKKYYDGEKITRTSSVSFRASAKKNAQMEIVRQVPDIATTEWSQQTHQSLDAVQSLRIDLNVQKMVIEALTTLLIERGLVSRDDLAAMIEQKKMGL